MSQCEIFWSGCQAKCHDCNLFQLECCARKFSKVKTLCPAELKVQNRAEVRRSFITTTVSEESQVTPQGHHS